MARIADFGAGTFIFCRAWKEGGTGRLEGMGETASVDFYFLLGLLLYDIQTVEKAYATEHMWL